MGILPLPIKRGSEDVSESMEVDRPGYDAATRGALEAHVLLLLALRTSAKQQIRSVTAGH